MPNVKVNVLLPFERHKKGDVTELTATKASALEKMGLVEPATKTAEKQIAKADKPSA
ncbi:hypothetical protein PMI09_02185 [Rhizobium sp. CF122]|uniref:hypothetical protein n=1 Tax=Rhizobium sp. CF122 TaxID=1144312 RepID=UPI000271D330|nr:hypothetical protein [Rhizobium sp. CF122]EJL54869.1 hypothetical protein PMI09_02185 [Rhizobium sp. CF122]